MDKDLPFDFILTERMSLYTAVALFVFILIFRPFTNKQILGCSLLQKNIFSMESLFSSFNTGKKEEKNNDKRQIHTHTHTNRHKNALFFRIK